MKDPLTAWLLLTGLVVFLVIEFLTGQGAGRLVEAGIAAYGAWAVAQLESKKEK